MTLLLKHSEIGGLLTVDETIAAVRQGFVEQGEGHVQVPPRTTIDSASGHGWLRVMPAILNGSGMMGYKAMHSTPGVGVRYLVMLYDLKSGELLAVMDADWLTSERTAATAAIGADVLARREIDCVGILGSSEQARAMLRAMTRVRNVRRVKVFSPTRVHREQFAASMDEQLNVSITPVDSAEQAVTDCDLLLSIFRSGRAPLVLADWIRPGTHITAASSVRPEARELDDGVWRKSAIVAVDDRVHAFESGDGRSALASGAASPECAVELWELLSGRAQSRQNADEITLFKPVGTALQDLAMAAAIYRRAKARGLGTEIGDFPHVR